MILSWKFCNISYIADIIYTLYKHYQGEADCWLTWCNAAVEERNYVHHLFKISLNMSFNVYYVSVYASTVWVPSVMTQAQGRITPDKI